MTTVKNYASRRLEPTNITAATHMHPFMTFNFKFQQHKQASSQQQDALKTKIHY
jgi:hypothetical protein